MTTFIMVLEFFLIWKKVVKKEGKNKKTCMSTTGFEPPTSLGLYWPFSFLALGQKPLVGDLRSKL